MDTHECSPSTPGSGASKPTSIANAQTGTKSEPHYCEDCDLVHERKLHPRQWLCGAKPRVPERSFVKREAWVYGEPYERCKSVNFDGLCPFWVPLRGKIGEDDGC